ncbi:MAG: ATP synthase F0 subunit C [Oscillospiraceae bacterium]|nr:ATP synthase F0 subunit C [Oscillospiraceae bacterium]
MKPIVRILLFLLLVTVLASLFALPALAAEEGEAASPEESSALDVKSVKALAAAGLIAVAAGAGAVSMAISIGKSAESTARQPEASGSIRSSLMLGLVFLETAIIYALIVAILIIFVL